VFKKGSEVKNPEKIEKDENVESKWKERGFLKGRKEEGEEDKKKKFHCKLCDITSNDSYSFVNHLNSIKRIIVN
jgi:hypothetical protein